MRKFVELPYHKYKLETADFANSFYLTNLKWLHEKLIATGCVHLLNDVCLVNVADGNSNRSNPSAHLVLLKALLERHFRALNYDGQQFFSVLHACIEASSIPDNEILKQWRQFIETSSVSYLQKLELSEAETTEAEPKPEAEKMDAEKPAVTGYDLLMNLNIDGYFVISLSTEREEICVWDVAK